ncbi:MAG TPA: cold shock domain-containing protein [Chitinophagales bacterium]|nr:cold shock domain-containing protein [Chitinophagales bacterium]
MTKKENEKNKQKKREDKALRKEQRKANVAAGSSKDMIAYVDEYGNLSSTPPDPSKKTKIKAEDIVLGVPKRETGPSIAALRSGTVTMFNESKGYGFIRDAETGESIFTHVNEHVDKIHEHDRVTFRIAHSRKGQNAVEVKIAVK